MQKLSIQDLTLPAQAHLMAKISQIAYLDPPKSTIAFAEIGFKAEFIEVKNSQIYLLTNETDAVVVCRGTEPSEFADIKDDLKIGLTKSSTGIGRVHRGFKDHADRIWPTLEPKIAKLSVTKNIWCTGHSLGAAVALLSAVKAGRNKTYPNPIGIFTFASPRVGDDDYVRMINTLDIPHYRFVNNADIVPRLPPFPYQHHADMYYMNHWGNIREMTWMQLIKDRLRGFVKGIKLGNINYFTNHAIARYVANLERWARGEERLQDKI